MIPSEINEEAPRSEKTVFEAFKEKLPPDWIVIWGRRFILAPVDHGRAWEGEVDFLVFSPRHGYLGLEVKGGKRISKRRNAWFSIDHNDVEHPIKDPGKQAQSGTHALARL